MKIYPIGLCNSLLLLLFLSGSSTAKAGQSCSYDPSLGKPNPLGMRTYITAKEESGDSTFVYEEFPAVVGENVTLSTTRELVFYKTNISKARTLLLHNRKYYSELVGYEDPEGFAPFNAVFVCR